MPLWSRHIVVSNDIFLGQPMHYSLIVSKAYRILGLLQQTFGSSSPIKTQKAYVTLVRSQLTYMYCSTIYVPFIETCCSFADYAEVCYKMTMIRLRDKINSFAPTASSDGFWSKWSFFLSIQFLSSSFNSLDYLLAPFYFSAHFYFSRLPQL